MQTDKVALAEPESFFSQVDMMYGCDLDSCGVALPAMDISILFFVAVCTSFCRHPSIIGFVRAGISCIFFFFLRDHRACHSLEVRLGFA